MKLEYITCYLQKSPLRPFPISGGEGFFIAHKQAEGIPVGRDK